MSKKQNRPLGDAFGGFLNETAAESSSREMGVRSDAFNSVVNSDKTRYIDISKIEPDPMQPRRAIPHEIRQGWQLTAENMPAFLQFWSEHTGIDLRATLESTSDEDRPEPDSPSQAALLSLLDLASSIRRDGLQNPISVIYTVTNSYGIETGERRWLAYHLLNLAYPGEYHLILVRQVNERNVWRQASENNARENLNAIARARQLALLLMDLHDMNNFQSFSAFQHEQEFYAQVADGDELRIPRGKTEQVFTAMNLKSDVQIRQYRALLRLPQEAWEIADDMNIPERTLRGMMSRAKGDALVNLLKEYKASLNKPVAVDTSENIEEEQDAPEISQVSEDEKRFNTFHDSFTRFRERQQRFIEKALPHQREQAIILLEKMIADLKKSRK